MQVALATVSFYEDTPEDRIKIYKDDLTFFHNLLIRAKLGPAAAPGHPGSDAEPPRRSGRQ